MKILNVINTLSSGGAEVLVTDLVIALNKIENTEVDLLIYGDILDDKGLDLSYQLKKHNINLINLKIKSSFLKPLIPILISFYIHKNKYDIVHSHLEKSDFFVALSKYFLLNNPIKKVRTIHSIKSSKSFPTFIHRYLCRNFDTNFFLTKQQYEDFDQKKYVKNYFINQSGIDISGIKPQVKDNDINLTRIIFIGSFDKRFNLYMKGQDFVIDALKEIKNIKINIDFIGGGSSIEEIKQKVLLNNMEDKIKFHGLVPDISMFIEKSDVYLSASLFEGLPISTIECAVRGLPLILPNIKAFDIFDNDSTIFYESNSKKVF